MKKGATLRGEIAKLQGVPKQYQQGWTEFYEQSSRTHKPIQYERGYCEFYKLKFYLTPDVLIPRPETELLVDEVIKLVNRESVIGNRKKNSINDTRYPITILDIGTGSGCIAISIAKNLPNAKIIAIDLSKKALEVAEKNSRLHQVENQILFLESDLLSAFQLGVVKPKPDSNQYDRLVYHINKPDIVVANLPYIPSARLMLIDPMVTDFEPRIALDGGIDGFEIYRRLFKQIVEKNFYPKYLICEIDEEQGEIALVEAKKLVVSEVEPYFPKAKIEIKKDLAKKDRILIVRF